MGRNRLLPAAGLVIAITLHTTKCHRDRGEPAEPESTDETATAVLSGEVPYDDLIPASPVAEEAPPELAEDE